MSDKPPTGQKDVSLLSDEELRIKVAEFLGWKPYGPPFGDKFGPQCWTREDFDPNPDKLWIAGNIPEDKTYQLPWYHRDLNAMHEAEKMLSEAQWSLYRIELDIVCERDDEKKFGYRRTHQSFWHSTARQRAEAFVLTMTSNS